MNQDPKSGFNRQPTRLKGYDYSLPGAYFVTICSYRRQCLFGEVVNCEMVLNPFGKILWEVWYKLPERYPHIELDAFIAMPDHVHAIIMLNDIPLEDGFNQEKGEGLKPSPTNRRHALPEIIRGFKVLSAKRINTCRRTAGVPVWQRSFYDHIIRNRHDLSEIRKYIAENPQRWGTAEKDSVAG